MDPKKHHMHNIDSLKNAGLYHAVAAAFQSAMFEYSEFHQMTRRERMAAAVASGYFANPAMDDELVLDDHAAFVIGQADAILAELDRGE